MSLDRRLKANSEKASNTKKSLKLKNQQTKPNTVERYNFKEVENKWQSFWDKEKTFASKIDKSKKNFIV